MGLLFVTGISALCIQATRCAGSTRLAAPTLEQQNANNDSEGDCGNSSTPRPAHALTEPPQQCAAHKDRNDNFGIHRGVPSMQAKDRQGDPLNVRGLSCRQRQR
jgi:hypothetical protein